jgi:hypothetical protein
VPIDEDCIPIRELIQYIYITAQEHRGH